MKLIKNLGFYISLFFLVVSTSLIYGSSSMEYYGEFGPGPGLLPFWTGVILLFLAGIYLIISIKKDIILAENVLPHGEGLINLLICIGTIIVFILIVPYTGFTIGAIILLFPLFSRGYKIHYALSFSVFLSVVVFFLFSNLLGIPLPTNNFGF